MGQPNETIFIRQSIINAALPEVPFDGWNWPLIEKSAIDAGYTQDMAWAVFPGKMDDVYPAFSAMADQWMLNRLGAVDKDPLKIRERIRMGVWTRLQCLEPHKEAVRLSFPHWAIPFKQGAAAKIIWQTADHIWLWAGDTSTDYNHYTKRILLSGVITATTLYWLSDQSVGHSKTLNFLERRIQNVLSLGKIMNKLKPAPKAS